MRDDPVPEDEEPEATELDRRLQSLPADPVPENLLSRCLNTIGSELPVHQPRSIHRGRWLVRLSTAAAAVVLISGVILLARPRSATAAGFLQAVGAGWTEVPACHRLVTFQTPTLSRTMEAWYVRGKGGREETRSGDKLVGVVINNGRWEFRWDVAEHLVAAWSPALLGKRSEFERAGLIQNSEALLRWAESHKADIHIEPDTLGGKTVRKVILRWPGPGGTGSQPQVDTFWFDPDTLRPVKQQSASWDGGMSEATYDYPAPENVPADLLRFQIPPDATVEINDPDLGRQVYSEPRTSESDPNDTFSKGAR